MFSIHENGLVHDDDGDDDGMQILKRRRYQ